MLDTGMIMNMIGQKGKKTMLNDLNTKQDNTSSTSIYTNGLINKKLSILKV